MAGESLNVTAGNAAGQEIPLEQELVIGRSTPGQGSLGGDSEISRVHARVYRDASGQLMVEDLGSTNGTFVNGNRISGQQALNPGDEVRVGQTTMSVEGGGALAGGAALDAERRLAEAHLVARPQWRRRRDAVAVHERAVRRTEVLDGQLPRGVPKHACVHA